MNNEDKIQHAHDMADAAADGYRDGLRYAAESVPEEKQYPSMSLYPDAKEYAAACGEVVGWNSCRKAMLAAAERPDLVKA